LARQRRRRRKGPAEYPGPRKRQLPFPINLIFNVKAFYVFFIVVMIASMAAVGLGVGQSPNPTKPIIQDLTPAPSVTPNVQSFDSPGRVLDGTEPYKATLTTNQGDIVIEFATDTPEAVNSFAFLAAKGYFDDTAFFYVDKTYLAQAGDPNCSLDSEQTCTGFGDPGYSLPLETGSATHDEWAVAMPAIGETNRVAGSQFRIFFVPDDRLDGKETVFGRVVEGQDILSGTPDLKICSALTQSTPDCTDDLTQALIIEDVVVEPA
jgi:cyclophilin family peptidyl-prolyl cis-trans isomerase